MTMPDYFLAPALVTLRAEVNKAFPKRDKTTDGWIGDPSHAARKSEHNPCWYCTGDRHGIVRALDIDVTPDGDPTRDLAAVILRATIGDPRVWYVIHKGKIYSRTNGWQPRVYKGAPHDGHVHVSLNGPNGVVPDLNFSTAGWGIAKGSKPPAKDPRPPAVSVTNIKNAARHPRRATNPVHTRRVQRALNAHLDAGLTVDGIYGPSTRAAARRWQLRQGFRGPDADGILGLRSLTALGRGGRFRVVR